MYTEGRGGEVPAMTLSAYNFFKIQPNAPKLSEFILNLSGNNFIMQLFSPFWVLHRFVDFEFFSVNLSGCLTFWKKFEIQDGGSKMAAVLTSKDILYLLSFIVTA